MPKKTDTRERIYQYLKEYTEKNGKSPSISEVKEYFGFDSSGTIYHHLHRLEKDGLIEIGRVRDMKKFSKITVNGAKMRNIDAFNATFREEQRVMLEKCLEKIDKDEENGLFYDLFWAEMSTLVDGIMEWLYSPVE